MKVLQNIWSFISKAPEGWRHIKSFARSLEPARFSIIVLLLGGAVLILVPQGQDAVLALAGASLFHRFMFGASALLWAIQIWYWTRILYLLKNESLSPNPSFNLKVVSTVPRVLGFLAFFVVTVSLFNAHRYSKTPYLAWWGLIFLILSILFYWFVTKRRVWFKIRGLKEVLEEVNTAGHRHEGNTRMSDLPLGMQMTLTLLSLAATVPFVFILTDPHNLTFGGGVAVAIVCFSIWIPLGSWLLYLSHRWKLPVFSILIIITMIFSFWNNNHHVRVNSGSTLNTERLSLDVRLDKFLDATPPVPHKGETEAEPAMKKTVYLVSAEGGGIRAAYWTAILLATLQDKIKDHNFGQHVFAISGVSGGSLGAAVFTALLKEKLQTKESNKNMVFVQKTDNILGEDFLSPTIGMMLTGDLLQRIIPFPVNHFSRGLALERAFENAWEKECNNKRFAEPMDNLWKGDDKCQIPSLFLNGTLVETGKRIIASNLKIDKRLVDAMDVYNFTEKAAGVQSGQDMPLSTAVHGSARFTYISPAGTLFNGFNIVDGGYFDNSGAVTALELHRIIQDKLAAKYPGSKLITFIITNDPAAASVTRDPHPSSTMTEPLSMLSGLSAPLETFFNAWTSHATYAKRSLYKRILRRGKNNDEEPKIIQHVFHFSPDDEDIKLPLGWSLSGPVRKDLVGQAEDIVTRYLNRR